MRTLIATLIALMLFATTPVAAGDYEDGLAALKAGNYQKALRLLKALSKRDEDSAGNEDKYACTDGGLNCGDVRAQLRLGIMYRIGQGVPQDNTKAAYWFTKAAKHWRWRSNRPNQLYRMLRGLELSQKEREAEGVARQNWHRVQATAQTHLGLMYANGEGVPEDDAKAVYWFKKAMLWGFYEPAYLNLGLMYEKGEGVPQDYATAVDYYAAAAKRGYAEAQSNLGLMYVNGYGVPKDRVRAYAWFSIAAAQGGADGKKGKNLVAKYMTPAQIAEAQKLSREYWEKYVVPFQK
jgi:uncharacterized protein